MSKRLIGYATTNSSGVATLNYTGQGLGEVDIVAETGGEMLFHYIGTGGTETDSFYYNTTDIQVSATSTGTTVSNVGSTGRTYWANMSGTSSSSGDEWNTPLIVECDIVSASDNVALQFVVGSNAVSRKCSELGITNGGHIKVVLDGSTVKYYVNGSDTASYTANWSISNFSIRFYVVNGQSFKYKNFFIYRGSTQLTSDPIQLLDCQFYDNAITGKKNQNVYYNANCQETVGDTGTTISYTGSSSYLQYRFGQTNNTDKPFNIGTKIEFDVVDVPLMAIVIYGFSNYSRALPTSTGKITITIDGDYIRLYQDNTQITYVQTSNYISGNFGFGFTTNNSSGSIKYKDMKIYPI